MGDTDRGMKKSRGDHSEQTQERDLSRFEGDEHGQSPDVGQPSQAKVEAGHKAFEGHDTQAAARAEQEVVVRPDAPPDQVGVSQTRRAEDMIDDKGKEPGRYDVEDQDRGGDEVPAGRSTMRDSTGVDPQEPIVEDSPTIPSGDHGS